jgi:hypothetical protein
MAYTFKNREQILGLLSRTDDEQITKDLIHYFDNLKKVRSPLYLDAEDFEKILKWKLRSQFGRQKAIRAKNTPEIIKIVTQAAFSITHNDPELEGYFRIRTLKVLVGVETAVASAILTVCYPDQYGVIDFRIWRQLFGEKKSSFSSSDYKKYIGQLQELAAEYAFSVQQIDHAIWQYDIEQNPS